MATRKKKVSETIRRKPGEGSIYQDKYGRWFGAIRIEQDDGTKIRKKVSGTNYEDVAKKLIELTGRMNILKNSILYNKTFGELFKNWLLVFKKSAVGPRTFETGIRNYKLHIEPYIGKMKIEDVTRPVVQQVINEVLAKEKTTNTAKKVKFLLNQFFEYAEECEWVTTNPTRKILIRKRSPELSDSEHEYKAIKPEMRMKFLQALNEHLFLKPLCMTSMFAGLRIGEILGLKWCDIDFENKTISISRGVVKIPEFDNDGNIVKTTTVIGRTKTSCSVREVPVPDILLNALKDWKKERWVKQQLTGVDLLKDSALVFGNDDGSIRTYSGTRKIFDNFTKKHGFYRQIHFHTLRHTYSNMLFEMNENPKVIQALLGHKSVKTTLTVYNSVDKSYYNQATEKLNNLFNEEKMAEYKVLEQKKNVPVNNLYIPEAEEDEDPEIAMLQKMIAERRARKQQDSEM